MSAFYFFILFIAKHGTASPGKIEAVGRRLAGGDLRISDAADVVVAYAVLLPAIA